MITIGREWLNEGAPSPELLRVLLAEYQRQRVRLDRLKSIYDLHHDIETRVRLNGLPNHRLINDFPGYIVAITSGYLVGDPVGYTPPEGAEKPFEALAAAMKNACVENVDAELAVDAAIYGKGVELCYADDSADPCVSQVDARSAFVVYDDTVEHKPVLGVLLRDKCDRDLVRVGQYVTVYTQRDVIDYERTGNEAPRELDRKRHFFGGVPMIEYWNNAREIGDFERVLSQVDAYDVLQSDRVNDKQQFTDAVFVLKGVGSLGVDDTEEERCDEQGNAVPASREQRQATPPSVRLRQTRTLFLPGDGADAGFVTKPDAEGGNETLRQSLADDIHKFSMVPDLTDEAFAGNASGVAMKYKLFGLEQLTKIKERWFREGLRQRLRLFCHFLAMRGNAAMDADAIQICFSRSLPVNDLEIAQTVATYDGLVPQELLLAQVPFVEDVKAAMQMTRQEQAQAAKRQRAVFGTEAFRETEAPAE